VPLTGVLVLEVGVRKDLFRLQGHEAIERRQMIDVRMLHVVCETMNFAGSPDGVSADHRRQLRSPYNRPGR
jgi:hypothetical protein